MTTAHPIRRRVLALDVRPQRAGYAVFEGAGRLLDAGLTIRRTGADIQGQLKAVFQIYRPHVLLIRRIERRSRRNHPRTRVNLRTARRLAFALNIRIVQISEQQIRAYFENADVYSKYQIASSLASTFPELAHRLPPARKLWQSERARMSIFDAVSYGVAYFALLSTTDGNILTGNLQG